MRSRFLETVPVSRSSASVRSSVFKADIWSFEICSLLTGCKNKHLTAGNVPNLQKRSWTFATSQSFFFLSRMCVHFLKAGPSREAEESWLRGLNMSHGSWVAALLWSYRWTSGSQNKTHSCWSAEEEFQCQDHRHWRICSSTKFTHWVELKIPFQLCSHPPWPRC